MWILVKHPPKSDGSVDSQLYLLAGRKYVVGRKDCDLVIPGDISISRKHATILVSNVDPADEEQPPERITITDTSKVGVLINGSKIKTDTAMSLKDGDYISFGRLNMKYKLTNRRLVIVTSCINTSSSKAMVKSCIQKLGGYTLQNWNEKATHLVMEKLTFTIKVVCALACGKHVVSVKYLEDLLDCCDKKTSVDLPHEENYLPPIAEQSLIHHQQLFRPNDNRCSLMTGKLFIILSPLQFKRIKEGIQYAGGQAVLKDTKDAKFVSQLSSSQTIVMQVEKKDEKGATKEQMSWINDVYTKLTQQNLRPIRESEVGLAILHATLDKYCNPTLKTAPAITGTSHTQMIADSICVTQQTQNLDDTQPLESVSNPQLDHTVPVISAETASTAPIKNSNNESPLSKRKRHLASENDNLGGIKDQERLYKKPKLKNCDNISLIDDDDNDLIEIFTGKSKSEKDDQIKKEVPMEVKDDKNVVPKSLANETMEADKLNKTESKNIINIDHDDDEDDVFSFNFSQKPTMSLRTLDYDQSEINTNQLSETIPVNYVDKVPDASLNKTSATNNPVINETNFESDVLFKSLSKKRVPDSYLSSSIPETCLPSAITPLSKKNREDFNTERQVVAESFLTVAAPDKQVPSGLSGRRFLVEDDDEDDDPFSFSVDHSSRNRKHHREDMHDKEHLESTCLVTGEHRKSPHKKNDFGTDKLVSDSDISMNRSSTDDEMQRSRYLKALSSSQDSDVENVFLSDADGNLISKNNMTEKNMEGNTALNKISEDMSKVDLPAMNANNPGNDADLSYLLDDDDIVSKEFSLQNQRNYVVLDGFISTLDKRPEATLVKEEDPDLVGVDTDLVQTIFVSLVVNEPNSKKKHAVCDINHSKSKNFKTFKKQYYAGRSKKKRYIGKNDLVKYESENHEKAALFADIRDKEKEEDAENRRIDEMFEAMSGRKGKKR